jgi:hypothetical protein
MVTQLITFQEKQDKLQKFFRTMGNGKSKKRSSSHDSLSDSDDDKPMSNKQAKRLLRSIEKTTTATGAPTLDQKQMIEQLYAKMMGTSPGGASSSSASPPPAPSPTETMMQQVISGQKDMMDTTKNLLETMNALVHHGVGAGGVGHGIGGMVGAGGGNGGGGGGVVVGGGVVGGGPGVAPVIPPPGPEEYSPQQMSAIKGWMMLPALAVPEDANMAKALFHVDVRDAGGDIGRWRNRLTELCAYSVANANAVRSRAECCRIVIRRCPFA